VVNFLEVKGTGPKHYVVQYERHGYYKLSFEVEPFLGTGVGTVPKNFVTSKIATTMSGHFS